MLKSLLCPKSGRPLPPPPPPPEQPRRHILLLPTSPSHVGSNGVAAVGLGGGVEQQQGMDGPPSFCLA